MAVNPMALLRRRALLSCSHTTGLSTVRVPLWSQTRQIQTRGRQNQSRQPARNGPQRSSPQPSRSPHQTGPVLDETQFISEPVQAKRETEGEEEPDFSRARVRFLRPAIWTLIVSSGIYSWFAYSEAKSELENRAYTRHNKNLSPARRPSSQTSNAPPTPTELVTRAWREMDPISRLNWSIIGLNGAVHLSQFVVPRFWSELWHLPALNRNVTLFSSIFVHSGIAHLGFNTYATYNFLPATGYGSLFRGDPKHMISFYLSTGIISSLAQHIASGVFTRGRAYHPAFIPSGGASGALFAVIGAFCAQNPHHGIGIILIPYHVEAQYFFPAYLLFELVGMIRGYSFVQFGHAAHLSGAVIGYAYAYFDGHKNVWRPLVDAWKRRLQSKKTF